MQTILANGQAAATAGDARSGSGSAGLASRSILLLERISGASQPWAALLLDAGHRVEVGVSKEAAFNRLFEAGEGIDVLLLDASLTESNVITIAREFRRLLIAHCVPVIRLAAARDDERMAAAIRAGISQYVQVPCAQELLLALIDAAAKLRAEQLRLRASAEKSSQALAGLTEGTFRFRTPEDVERIAPLVAGVCPAPDRVLIGLTELMFNAIEHGNLAIGHEAKRRINAQGLWLDEIRRRLDAPEQADRYASVSFRRDGEGASIRIEDSGAGFDWAPYLAMDQTQAAESRGRGIAVARMLSFDSLVYSARGNVVTAFVRDPRAPLRNNPA